MFFDFAAVKKSVQSLSARLTSLRTELETLQRQREAIHYAPASKDDVKARVSHLVKQAGIPYIESLGVGIAQFARSPHTPQMGGVQSLITLNGLANANDPAGDPQAIGQALCALMGPSLLDALLKNIDAMPWPENALPLAGRSQQINELDTRIAKLQNEEQEIITKAQDVGITLE